MDHDCKYEKVIGSIETNIKNIKEHIRDIKENHLNSIYDKFDCVLKKISGRPSWLVLGVITSLTTLVGILLTALLNK